MPEPNDTPNLASGESATDAGAEVCANVGIVASADAVITLAATILKENFFMKAPDF